MNIPVVYHPDYFSSFGAHVFPAEKFRLIHEGLSNQIDGFDAVVHRPAPASEAQLLRVHTPAYLADLRGGQHTDRTLFSELPMTPEIVGAFTLMAGGTCLASLLALQHGAAMNLGGGFHHAFADKAEGFCYLNDVAVAVREVLAEHAIERAAVIDADLHQGNGTARIFQNEPAVFTFSIHQENNYPLKERSDLDIGLPDGTQDQAYLDHLQSALEVIFSQFQPQFVVYVGGVDPYEHDQLGGLKLSKAGLQNRDQLVFQYCRSHQVPVAAVLAGGYAYDVRDTVEMHINSYMALRDAFT